MATAIAAAPSGGGVNLDKFFDDVKGVKEELKELDRILQSLKNNNELSKTVLDADAGKDLCKRMYDDVTLAFKQTKRVKLRLNALERSNAASRSLTGCGSDSSSDRIRTSVVKDILESYNDLRDQISSEYRITELQRHFILTGEKPVNDAFYTKCHGGPLYTAACSPTDPALVATDSILWKIRGKNEERGWSKLLNQGYYGCATTCLAFSYDGQLIAIAHSNEGVIEVWEVATKKLIGMLTAQGSYIYWLRWHPKEHKLLASYADSSVIMWNADTLECIRCFAGHGPITTCGDFTPDGKLACTGCKDGILRIWEPETGENIHVVWGSQYHTKDLKCLAITSTSALALTGSSDGSAHIVDITTGSVIDTLASSHSDKPKSILSVGFAPSNCLAAIAGMDQRLKIWDIEHSSPQSTCVHESAVTSLAWVGSSYVATGCMNGIVKLWDIRSGKCAQAFRGHKNSIQSLSVTANGDYLVSASYDSTARVFEVAKFH